VVHLGDEGLRSNNNSMMDVDIANILILYERLKGLIQPGIGCLLEKYYQPMLLFGTLPTVVILFRYR